MRAGPPHSTFEGSAMTSMQCTGRATVAARADADRTLCRSGGVGVPCHGHRLSSLQMASIAVVVLAVAGQPNTGIGLCDARHLPLTSG